MKIWKMGRLMQIGMLKTSVVLTALPLVFKTIYKSAMKAKANKESSISLWTFQKNKRIHILTSTSKNLTRTSLKLPKLAWPLIFCKTVSKSWTKWDKLNQARKLWRKMLLKSEGTSYQMGNNTRVTCHHIYSWTRMPWLKVQPLKSSKKAGKQMLITKEHRDRMK